MHQNDAFFNKLDFTSCSIFLTVFFPANIKSIQKREKRASTMKGGKERGGEDFKMRMIQEIVNFVDPDLTVEFDPASRVSGHTLRSSVLLFFLSFETPLRRCNVFPLHS